MKNSRHGDRSGGPRSDFKRRSFGRGGSGQRFGGGDSGGSRMHQATCADCGKTCEVPFRPSGDRPVYCSDCFGKHRNRDAGRHDDRPRWEDKRMFSATCANCGNACEVPFRPSGDKPVYCKDCFGKMGKGDRHGRPPDGSGQSDVIGQFKQLNSKLDAILSALAVQPAKDREKKPVTTKTPKPAKKKRAK